MNFLDIMMLTEKYHKLPLIIVIFISDYFKLFLHFIAINFGISR